MTPPPRPFGRWAAVPLDFLPAHSGTQLIPRGLTLRATTCPPAAPVVRSGRNNHVSRTLFRHRAPRWAGAQPPWSSACFFPGPGLTSISQPTNNNPSDMDPPVGLRKSPWAGSDRRCPRRQHRIVGQSYSVLGGLGAGAACPDLCAGSLFQVAEQIVRPRHRSPWYYVRALASSHDPRRRVWLERAFLISAFSGRRSPGQPNCHSMPRCRRRGRSRRIPWPPSVAEFSVLGDRGRAPDPAEAGNFTAFVGHATTLRPMAYEVSINDPYKGVELVAQAGPAPAEAADTSSCQNEINSRRLLHG